MKNILENACQLLHQRKYKEGEELLIKFVEQTISQSSSHNHIDSRKEIYHTFYRSFNNYYLSWLKKNKVDIKTEKQKLKSNYHDNFLIAKSSKVPEMDDLLFELGNFLDNLNSKEQKKELLYHLHCYKNGQRI